MRKFVQVSFVISLVFLTSCFDVLDEITLNADGSGTYGLTVNLSKSKTKIATMMALKDGKTPTEAEINEEFDRVVDQLKTMSGISRVVHTSDFDNYIFMLEFDFEKVENLNRAVAQIITSREKEDGEFSISYQFNKASKKFTRGYTYRADEDKVDEQVKAEDQDLLKEAYYTSICRFSGQVTSCSNREAKISKSGKSVLLRSSAYDLIKGKSNLSNTVLLK